jgi:hypothetical protein
MMQQMRTSQRDESAQEGKDEYRAGEPIQPAPAEASVMGEIVDKGAGCKALDDNYLGKHLASTRVKHRSVDLAAHARFVATLKAIAPAQR